jgi:hypothetical protein
MIIIEVLSALVLIHLIGGLFRHGQHRRRGLRPSLRYTYGRGWWGSVSVGGFRIGHRL